MRISVVIPYYQRERDILARALKSIFNQQLDSETHLDVIVVNDASPFDPAVDIAAAGAPPPRVTVRVVARSNGGPAAARNTGFDAVTNEADHVALLDSDDMWRSNHIVRAIAGLRASGADVYFSSYTRHNASDYLKTARMFTQPMPGPDDLKPLPGDGYLVASGRQIAAYAAREFLAHSSTVVCNATLIRSGLRMPERLRWAGEDHNFFIDMTLLANRVCVSVQAEADLGKGVSIYEDACEWGSLKDLRRRAYNIASNRRVQRRFNWPRAVRHDLSGALAAGRRVVGYLLMRRVVRLHGPDMEALGIVWSVDRQTVLCAPFSVLDVFARKLLRRVWPAVTP